VRYAWRRGGKTWLGATPETLVQVQGQQLTTQALAGTRPTDRADELLASLKDRHEHAVVVQAIRRAIEPFTCELPRPASPWCATCAAWRTCRPPSPPACAKTRTSCAWCWPAPHARGVRLAGRPCGRLAQRAGTRTARPVRRPLRAPVAFGRRPCRGGLRGAVLEGRLAVLPAGAGIVAGSEGEAELAETRVKQGSVLDAFRGAD
jgi:salicylate biosynthesis isochorismate synthase